MKSQSTDKSTHKTAEKNSKILGQPAANPKKNSGKTMPKEEKKAAGKTLSSKIDATYAKRPDQISAEAHAKHQAKARKKKS